MGPSFLQMDQDSKIKGLTCLILAIFAFHISQRHFFDRRQTGKILRPNKQRLPLSCLSPDFKDGTFG